jgi:hypothetical protein
MNVHYQDYLGQWRLWLSLLKPTPLGHWYCVMNFIETSAINHDITKVMGQ